MVRFYMVPAAVSLQINLGMIDRFFGKRKSLRGLKVDADSV